MQIIVERLRYILSLLEPVVPKKSTLPATTYVCLNEGRALGTDLEVAVSIANTSAGEGVCLHYATLVTLLASVPGNLTAEITADGKKATLTAGRTKATIGALPVEDFPPIRDFQPEHEAAVDGDALIRALTTVLPATASDDKRPVLNTVCLTLGESPEAAAADGYRLAWQAIPAKLPGEGNILIPTRAVIALEHLWRKAPKPPELEGIDNPAQLATAKRLVRVAYSQAQMRLKVSFGEVSLLAQLVQGKFPDYRQLIPTEGVTSVTFDARDLVRALKGIGRVAKDGSGIVRLYLGNGELKVEARNEDLGETSTVIHALCQGEGKIAFNYGYLLDYVKGKDGTVTLRIGTPSQPGLFAHRGTPNQAIMPMFTQWPGDPPTASPTAPEDTGQATAAEETGDSGPDETPPEAPEEALPARRPRARKARKSKKG